MTCFNYGLLHLLKFIIPIRLRCRMHYVPCAHEIPLLHISHNLNFVWQERLKTWRNAWQLLSTLTLRAWSLGSTVCLPSSIGSRTAIHTAADNLLTQMDAETTFHSHDPQIFKQGLCQFCRDAELIRGRCAVAADSAVSAEATSKTVNDQLKYLRPFVNSMYYVPATYALAEHSFSHGGSFMHPQRAWISDSVLCLVSAKYNAHL